MKNIKLSRFIITFVTLIFIDTSFVFAKGGTDYYDLAKNGTAQDITKAFKQNEDLSSQVFGSDRETFLMLVLKEDRPVDVVKVCIYNGCSVDAKSKSGKNSVIYATIYTTSDVILETIIKASPNLGNQSKKRVELKDSTGKSAFDYAKENENSVVFLELLAKYGEDPANKPVKTKKSKKTAVEEPTISFTENEYVEENVPVEQTAEVATQESVSTEQVAAVAVPPVTPEVSAVPVEQKVEAAATDKVAESVEQTKGTTEEESDEIKRVSAPKPEPSAEELRLAEEKRLAEEAEKARIAEELRVQQEKERIAKEEEERRLALIEAEKRAKEEALMQQKVQITQYTQTFLYDYIPEETEEVEETKTVNPIKDVNATDKNGVTLLMKACREGNDWDVKNLIKLGADVNLRDQDGWSALMYAVRYQNSAEIVNTLIKAGAYVRVRNKYNATPLLLAADYSKNPEILNILLNNRSVSEDEVYKAFIFTIIDNKSSDHIKIAKIQLFIDKGISLNRMWKGKTPLMYASEYGNSTTVIKLLIDNGAKPGLITSDGKTAFDFAKNNKQLEKDDIYWSLNSNIK